MGGCLGRDFAVDYPRRSHPSSYPVTYRSNHPSTYYPDDEYYVPGQYGRHGVHYLHESRPHHPSVTYHSGAGGYYNDDYRDGYYRDSYY